MTTNITPERLAEFKDWRASTSWKIWNAPEFREWLNDPEQYRRLGNMQMADPELRAAFDNFLAWAEAQVNRIPARTETEEIDYKAKWDALWADLHQEAKDREFCEEYDALVEKHGGPKRPQQVELVATLRFLADFPADIDLSRGVPDASTVGGRRTILVDYLLKDLEEGGTYDYERIRIALRSVLVVDSIQVNNTF